MKACLAMSSQTVPIQNVPCRAKSKRAKSKRAVPYQIKTVQVKACRAMAKTSVPAVPCRAGNTLKMLHPILGASEAIRIGLREFA